MQLDLPFNMEGQPAADNNTGKRARWFCDHSFHIFTCIPPDLI